jgi:hypothetical protein
MNLSHEMQLDGTVKVTIVAALPSPSTTENTKWKWVPWNVNYQKQQLEKDAARVLQSIANLKLVESTVASRAAQREEEKATKALAAGAAASQSQPQAAQTVVAEVAAPASSPTPAAKSPTKSRRGKRS